MPLAFFTLAIIGTIWADGPWKERLEALNPVLKFLVLPLLLYHFGQSYRGHWVLRAFVLSCALLTMFSWVDYFEPQWRLPYDHVPGAPIKNYIDQSHVLVLCAFVLMPIAIGYFNERRFASLALVSSLITAFLATLVFVVTSRTALVCVPVLIILLSVRHFSLRTTAKLLSAAVLIVVAVWVMSPHLRERVEGIRTEYLSYRDTNLPTSTGLRLAWWQRSLDFIAEAPIFGNGTGSTRRLFNEDAAKKTGLWAARIGNPHNQTLYVAIQWGMVGCILLYAMWFCHLMLFRGLELASWIGLVVVAQNIFSSLFNSHLFDFTEGWVYVVGVGVAGGVVRSARPAATWGEWHVHSTSVDTYWRRRRWYGWQIKRMTDAELSEYFEMHMDELRRSKVVLDEPQS
ncbi:O-antigen ligase family protein [Bradyrhizobium sp. ORS 86]|uniref:O-antigen ligase family protein n=1 Tax=Bradyrhizobium sp. ORS 86 TaxID=1685970 RepID=UPI00388FC867